MRRGILILSIGAIAILARIPQLSAPLWNDESFVWVVSGLPAAEWWRALAGDVHPPGYYALAWGISQISRDPLALRLPSLIFGLGVVALGAVLARSLGASEPAQAVAALILALAPQQIYYSAEVRMYALLAALYLAGAWAVLRRRYGLLGMIWVGLLYTHHYGAIYSLSLGVLALALERERRLEIVIAGIWALAFYAPLLPMTLSQIHSTGSYWAELSLEQVIITPALWLSGAPLTRPILGGALIAASLAILGAGIWRAIARRHYALLWITLGPLILGGSVAALFKNVWLTRVFIGSGAAAAVLLAIEIRPAWAAALIVPMLAAGAISDQTRPAVNDRYNSPVVADYLRAQADPGDGVLCLGSAAWMELQPYRLSLPVGLEESGEWLPTGGLSAITREAIGARPLAGDYRRLWVYVARIPGENFDPEIPPGARLIGAWTGTERVFNSALYEVDK